MSIAIKHPILLLTLALSFSQCKVNKNGSSANTAENRILQEVTVTGSRKSPDTSPYQESHKHTFDLIHTTLWLSFDYEKQYVYGKAKLTLHPYFYPQRMVALDAKKFMLHKVALLGKDTQNLEYTYNDKVLEINLGKTITRQDTVSLYIEYTARPNDITEEGSNAISEAKGLYFINPLKSDSSKPRQIWSQGETQSNSGWFPTIDYPNEKMTQEIYLTVQQYETTLSNGSLMYSKEHADGTRTDYWSQQLPHAPYLAMIAVGEFVETKDFWRDSIEVNSYLEKKYAPYARTIFGTTPEMMECFSKRLGVDYPWDKYSQIVVRDFVSGAMENTSAVIHFEPVQHDNREHLDNTWEDIISHELFHHWFGDLVTCESWSNLSLNESFATYGEYIWTEYKYGQLQAEYEFEDNLKAYLNQSSAHRKKLIRYHYRNREDMFDVVSYQKGGRILHMLRDYVGDEAFFASLKLYLTRHKFKTAEVHDLRLAFEEVTGEDLNWFFNQWYFNSGHPVLEVKYTYNETETAVKINVTQTQDTSVSGVFKLPVAIDVYDESGKSTRYKVWVDRANWEMVIETKTPIKLTTFDAHRILLAKQSENRTAEELAFQFLHGPTYKDKKLAVDGLLMNDLDSLTPILVKGINQALAHPFFGFRELALTLIAEIPPGSWKLYEDDLVKIAGNDPKASVRAAAIGVLSEWDGNRFQSVFVKGFNDSAYSVMAASLAAISAVDGNKALELSQSYLATSNKRLQNAINEVIAEQAKEGYVTYFEHQLAKPSYYSYAVFAQYNQYLLRQDHTVVQTALPQLSEWIQQGTKPFQYSTQAKQIVNALLKKYQAKVEEADKKIADKKLNEEQRTNWIAKRDTDKALVADLQAILGN